MPMRVLALDTALDACSVALVDGEEVRARRQVKMRRGQAERLIPMVGACLREAGLEPMGLDLIAVTTGPGAFTGIRIGLSAARGLALATGHPCVGVTTLEALAADAPRIDGRPIVVAIDARHGRLYAQVFRDPDAPLGPPWAQDVAKVAAAVPVGAIVVGGGAAVLCDALRAAGRDADMAGPMLPDPVTVARLGCRRWRAGSPPPRPLYLRTADVTPPVTTQVPASENAPNR